VAPDYLNDKKCSGCQQWFPRTGEFFFSDKRHRDGLAPVCKTCRISDAETLQGVQVYNRELRNARGRVKNTTIQRGMYMRDYLKKYTAVNADAFRTYSQRRRARKLSLPDTLTLTDWNNALDFFGHTCAVCGRSATADILLAQDHWIPLSKGGGTSADNIVPLCHGVGGCNNRKASHHPVKWLSRDFEQEQVIVILERIQLYFDWVKSNE
jgi:5-methylcytosine-specific restriction endonuclease McrA